MARPITPPPNPSRHIPQTHLPTAEWRCLECGKLLGVRRGGKLQVRVQGQDYLANLPVEATCRGCGQFNRT